VNCARHPNEPASPDCEGWPFDLCDRCLCGLGYPSMRPSIGALYAIGATLIAAEEARADAPPEHPEVLAYRTHFLTDNPLQVAV
jgi:hypothetical protein